MEAIFLNYRRSDSEGQARALFQNLVDRFGRDAVLLDVAGLEKGRDFRKTIDRRLTICKVMLAVIGRSWLDARDEQGAKRLDSSEDLVRIEIAAALGRDIPVIPVLVGGASMPRAADLPEDLKDLAFRDGVELTHARWDSDVQLLIKALEPYLGEQPAKTVAAQRSISTRVLLYVALACVLAGGQRVCVPARVSCPHARRCRASGGGGKRQVSSRQAGRA
ncbi:MAG: TIR domain-containing protein [Variovorax sp.]|nr:MAG: TIR domain-containing protein [Variovorax sp.]